MYKKCKGITEKTKGFGCGKPIKFIIRNKNKIYYSKYGLSLLECGCFYDWFNSQKIKPIKKLSQKRLNQNSEYLKLRLEFLSDNPKCQVIDCNKESNQVHHKKGRIGALLTDIRYFLSVCAECHEKIELEPVWSKKQGYSLNRLDR